MASYNADAKAQTMEWAAAEQELLIIWWNAGLSVSELARRFKRPQEFIRARTNELPPRTPTARKARAIREETGTHIGGHPIDDWSPWEDLLLTRLREEGDTFAEIGEKLGRHERACCRRFSQLKWSHRLAAPERTCSNPGCENVLSKWNVNSECFACQEARHARTA